LRQRPAARRAPRDFERVARYVCCHDRDVGPFARDGDGEAAAAGANIRDRCLRVGSDELGCRFDDELGLWTRDQHGRGDGDLEAPEFLVADDVGEWLAGDPASHQRIELGVEAVRRRFDRIGKITLGRPPKDVCGKQASVDVRFVGRDTRRPQLLPRRRDASVDGRHETAVASLSFSD
jgi:hypothetical protein